MMTWRLTKLMDDYREATGQGLSISGLARETGLAASTIHKLVHYPPLRVDLDTLQALLAFFTPALGPLTTQDLVEFVTHPES